MPLSGDYADLRTGGVGRQALRIASEPPPPLPLLLELLLRPPPPPPPPPPPALLELLGELAEGAADAEEPGEALCRAEYLGSTCRLPACGMLNACLLFRDIIILLPCVARSSLAHTGPSYPDPPEKRPPGEQQRRPHYKVVLSRHRLPALLGRVPETSSARASPARSVGAVALLRVTLASDLRAPKCTSSSRPWSYSLLFPRLPPTRPPHFFSPLPFPARKHWLWVGFSLPWLHLGSSRTRILLVPLAPAPLAPPRVPLPSLPQHALCCCHPCTCNSCFLSYCQFNPTQLGRSVLQSPGSDSQLRASLHPSRCFCQISTSRGKETPLQKLPSKPTLEATVPGLLGKPYLETCFPAPCLPLSFRDPPLPAVQ